MWVQFGYIIKGLRDLRVIGIKAVDPVSLAIANIGLANIHNYDIIYLNGFKKYIDNKEVTRVFIVNFTNWETYQTLIANSKKFTKQHPENIEMK